MVPVKYNKIDFPYIYMSKYNYYNHGKRTEVF